MSAMKDLLLSHQAARPPNRAVLTPNVRAGQAIRGAKEPLINDLNKQPDRDVSFFLNP